MQRAPGLRQTCLPAIFAGVEPAVQCRDVEVGATDAAVAADALTATTTAFAHSPDDLGVFEGHGGRRTKIRSWITTLGGVLGGDHLEELVNVLLMC